MKWRETRPTSSGQRRERVVFAWVPRLCEDGYYRWLERVCVVECGCYRRTRFGRARYAWYEQEAYTLTPIPYGRCTNCGETYAGLALDCRCTL